jgi:Calx-beta domain/EGF-like domain
MIEPDILIMIVVTLHCCYRCDVGYYGLDCSQACPGFNSTAGVCSRHGLCHPIIGSCFCESGWSGELCDARTCIRNCYNHGTCTARGKCDCSEGWSGPYCSSPAALPRPTVAYITLEAAVQTVLESLDAVYVTVERGGADSAAVSVQWSTADGTALAGTDYAEGHGVLSWPAHDAAPRTLILALLHGRQLPEAGELSFTITLSDAAPAQACALGHTVQTLVRIENSGGGSSNSSSSSSSSGDVARVTLLCRHAGASEEGTVLGETFRANLVRLLSSVLTVSQQRFFVVSSKPYSRALAANSSSEANSSSTSNSTAAAAAAAAPALVTVDILSPQEGKAGASAQDGSDTGASVAVVARQLIEAIANPKSGFYTADARASVGIDATYQPVVQTLSTGISAWAPVVATAKSLSGAAVLAIVVSSVLAVLLLVGAAAFYKRREILWRLAARSFRPLGQHNRRSSDTDGNEFEIPTVGQQQRRESDADDFAQL